MGISSMNLLCEQSSERRPGAVNRAPQEPTDLADKKDNCAHLPLHPWRRLPECARKTTAKRVHVCHNICSGVPLPLRVLRPSGGAGRPGLLKRRLRSFSSDLMDKEA